MSSKWLHPNFLFPPAAPEYGVHPKAVFNQVITFCSRLAVSICGQVGEKKQVMYWNQENVDTVAALAESVPTVQPSHPIIAGEYPPPDVMQLAAVPRVGLRLRGGRRWSRGGPR